MKKTAWIIIAVVVVALLISARLLCAPKPAAAPAGRQAPGMRGKGGKAVVAVYTVRPSPMQERVIGTGTIVADQDVELRSETAGRIVGLYFREGQPVKKGSLLLKINDADLQAQLAKAQASLSLAQEREQRQKSLVDKEMVSREEYQSAARDLAAARADAQLIASQIEMTEVRAPFDGVIGLRSVDQGGYVIAGAKIANLVSLRPLKVEFDVPERFAGKVRPGFEVAFTIEGSSVRYAAVVAAVEPKIDETTRTVKIRAVCKNPDKAVMPGAFAKVDMIVRRSGNALQVPSEALVPGVEGYQVYVVKDSTVTAQPVTTGIRDERAVEILTGLSPGDAVVVSGILSVRPGMTVEVRQAPAADDAPAVDAAAAPVAAPRARPLARPAPAAERTGPKS